MDSVPHTVTPPPNLDGLRFIFLNGPPRSGKDTIGAELKLAYEGAQRSARVPVEVEKFAAILKDRTHAFFGLTDKVGRPLPHDHYELVKNMPSDLFGGMSPRQAYIWMSEEVMKPKFGSHVFGELLAKKILRDYSAITRSKRMAVVITDSGFLHEAQAFRETMESNNVRATYHLARLHRDGATFEGDSRAYVRYERGNDAWPFDNDADFQNNASPLFAAFRVMAEVHRVPPRKS